jgi:peptidoglycan/LPS O-acetylase OafA/YrhL
MLFHFTPPHVELLAPIINNAYVFVGFFFLISGFVLAYNYADRAVLSKRRFYIARLSRVYPTYLLVLALSVPFLLEEWHAHTPHDFYLGLILTPLALQGWSPILATFWNTVGWTLPAEIMLYGVFPFLLLGLRRMDPMLKTPLRLAVAILIVWAIGITPHVSYLLLNPDHLTEPATRYTYAYWLRVLKYTPCLYLCTFTAGVLLARLHAMLELTSRQRLAMALSALTAIGLFFAYGSARTPYVLVHGALLLPLFATLLLALCGGNAVTSLLSWKPLVLFGETTFALYLLHFNAFLLIHFYHLPERLHVAALDPWISYAVIIAMAFAVSRYFEKPAREFVLRVAGSRMPAA